MGFVRFILSTRDPDSGLREGLFSIAYRLRDDADVPAHDRLALAELLEWFNVNLPVPVRFSRTRSKGYYRRKSRGIAWFRETAIECIGRMRDVTRILEEHGHPAEMIHADRIGYIVYEDAQQVIAEPFSDTRTS